MEADVRSKKKKKKKKNHTEMSGVTGAKELDSDIVISEIEL